MQRFLSGHLVLTPGFEVLQGTNYRAAAQLLGNPVSDITAEMGRSGALIIQGYLPSWRHSHFLMTIIHPSAGFKISFQDRVTQEAHMAFWLLFLFHISFQGSLSKVHVSACHSGPFQFLELAPWVSVGDFLQTLSVQGVPIGWTLPHLFTLGLRKSVSFM